MPRSRSLPSRLSALLVVVGVLALVVPALLAAAEATTHPEPTGYHALSPVRLLDTRTGGATYDGQGSGQGAIAVGAPLDLLVAGRAGIPEDGVEAVVLNVTATGPTAASWLTVYPAGTDPPGTSNLNFTPGLTVPNLVVVGVGAGGKVRLANARGKVDVVVDVAGWFATGSDLTSVPPSRIMDTRGAGLTVDGQASGAGVVRGGTNRSLKVTGRAGVPSQGVGAVIVNVTATGPTESSWITVYPRGVGLPTASNLNVSKDQTVPNLVVATVGTGGNINLYNAAGSVHLVVDVIGWLPVGASYNALTPTRLVDTRPGQPTADTLLAGVGKLVAGHTLSIPVAGRGGVPTSGVSAAVLNVTVTEPTASSWLTVFPGATPADTSNLNFTPGTTVPNLVVTPLGPDGSISVVNAFGAAHVVVDLLGWISAEVQVPDPEPTTTTTTIPDDPNLPHDPTIPLDGELGDLVLSADQHEAYLADKTHGTVLVLDVEAREIVATIPVGGTPGDMDLDPAGERLYVPLTNTHGIVAVDVATRSVVHTWATPTVDYYNATPRALAFGSDGVALLIQVDYPYSQSTALVYRFDPATGVIERELGATLDYGYASVVAASPDRSRIVVGVGGTQIYDVVTGTWSPQRGDSAIGGFASSSTDGSRWMYGSAVLDERGAWLGSFGSGGWTSVIDATGQYGWVAQQDAVDIVETTHFSVLGRVPIPDSPRYGAGMAALHGGQDLLILTLHGISYVSTDHPTAPAPLTGHGTDATVDLKGTAQQVVVDPNGTMAYVTNWEANRVDLVSLVTKQLVGSIPVGSRPYGLDITPDGKTLVVADQFSAFVSIVDLVQRNEVRRIDINAGFDLPLLPTQVAVADGKAFVTSQMGVFLTMIDLATDEVTSLWKGDPLPFPGVYDGAMVRASGDHEYLFVQSRGSGTDWWVIDPELGSKGVLGHRLLSGYYGQPAADADGTHFATGRQVFRRNTSVAGTTPYDVPFGAPVLLPDASRLLVVHERTAEVVETTHFRHLGTIGLPDDSRGSAVVTPDGLRLVVVTTAGLSIALTTPVIPKAPDPVPSGNATVVMGGEPFDVAIDDTGTLAFVTRPEDNAVDVVSLALKIRLATILVGSMPYGIDIGPNGHVYVANHGGDDLSEIDPVLLKEVRRIPVPPEFNATPIRLAIDAENRAFVTTSFPGSGGTNVAVVDLDTGAGSQVGDDDLGYLYMAANVEASRDRQRIVVSSPGVSSGPIAEYDLATDSWIYRETGDFQSGGLDVDAHGEHWTTGYSLYDGQLRDEGIYEYKAPRYTGDVWGGVGAAINPDGSRVYRVFDGAVDVLETAHYTHVGRLDLPDRSSRGDYRYASGQAELTPDGATLAAITASGLSIVSTANPYPVADPGPYGYEKAEIVTPHDLGDVLIDATNTYAYVADTTANRVLVVDIGQQKIVARILVGSRPTALAFTPNGTTLYVGHWGSPFISEVDVATRKEVRRIRYTLGDPFLGSRSITSIAIATDGTAVVSIGTRAWDPYVQLIDLATGDLTPLPVADLGWPPVQGGRVVSSADHTRLFSNGPNNRQLNIYDTRTHAWSSKKIPDSIEYFLWMQPDADGDRIYVWNAVMDDQFHVLKTVDRVGTDSDGERIVALSPDGRTLYRATNTALFVTDVPTNTTRTVTIDDPRSYLSFTVPHLAVTTDGATAVITSGSGISILDLSTST